jgi:hypothetical protein
LTNVDQGEFEIRRLLENWAVWRDSGNWEKLRTVWHAGGTMQATWFFGTGDEFVKSSMGAWERGLEVLHTLHGSSIEIRGTRAVAQTKMSIHQRASLDGVVCDCVCMGRFFDLLEKRDGRWGIVKRQPIYEKDRLDPVNTSEKLDLDREKLASLPAGYRHLAYLQLKIGLNVRLDLPGTRGPAVEALYAEGGEWLNQTA